MLVIAEPARYFDLAHDAGIGASSTPNNGSSAHLPDVEWVPAQRMFVPTDYQRPIIPARVKKIVNGFDPSLFGVLEVSLRSDSGMYAVMDGQQRLAAIREMHYEDQNLPSVVHRGLTVEDEARIFWMTNSSVTRSSLTAREVFRGRLRANDPVALDIHRIVVDAGFELALDSHELGGRRISAVGALNAIYGGPRGGVTLHGAEDLRTILHIVADAWGSESGSTRGTLLQGIHRFHVHYRNDYSRTRLVSVLSAIAPARVWSEGETRAKLLGMGTPQGIGQYLAIRYNSGLRSKRLPDW